MSLKKLLLLLSILVISVSSLASPCDIVDISKDLNKGKRKINKVHIQKYFCFENKNIKSFDFDEMDEFAYKYGKSKSLPFRERYTMFYPLKTKAEMEMKITTNNGQVYYVKLMGSKKVK